jgi:DNA-directed RNA polymerase specialized sigma24 family protein
MRRAARRLAGARVRHRGAVELRFYGGLTLEETADVLGISTGTVKREWGVACAWLFRELTEGGA